MSAVTVASLLGAAALLVERLVSLLRARREARAAAVEPAQVVASAAATVAASVEALLAPMEHAIAELRAEVHALRETLAAHGIPAPLPPFTPRPPLG